MSFGGTTFACRIGLGDFAMNLRVRDKLFVLVLTPLLVLIVLLSSFAWSASISARAATNTTRSIAALRLADRLNKTLIEAETGMRRYVATGNSQLLAPYLDAKAALALRIGLFEGFTGDEPATRAQALLVTGLAGRTVSIIDRYVALVERGERARAVSEVGFGAGRDTLDQFRLELANYRKLELDRYQTDTVHLRALEQGTYALLTVGSILAVVVTVLLYLMISRTLVRRIRRLESNAAAFADGKHVALSTADNDEIAEVEKSLQTMFRELQVRHESLAQLNVLQRAILDGTSYAIFTTATDGTITSFNRGAEQLLGYTAAEAVGQLSAQRFLLPQELGTDVVLSAEEPEHSNETAFRSLVESPGERHGERSEWTLIRADGTHVAVLATIAPLLHADGASYGYLGIANDMTERKAAELAARRHEAEQAVFTSQLRSLHAIANTVVTARPDQIDAALLLVLEELGLDWAYLGTVDAAKSELIIANSVGAGHELEQSQLPGSRMPLDHTHVASVLKTKRTIAIADLSQARRFDDLGSSYEGTGSYIAAPVKVSGRPYGVIGFVGSQSRAEAFSQSNLDFIQLTSDLIGAAIDRGLQRQRLDALAFFDELTGLPNRVLLQDRLLQTFLSAERHNERFAVLYVDIDDFGTINETFGHAMGENVLRAVAKRLTSLLRDSDTVARLGGDEFVVVASKLVDLANGATLAERILSTLCRPFTIDGVTHSLTASIGISLFPPDGRNAESLLNRADAALSSAKAQGKNRYAFADSAAADVTVTQRDGVRYVRLVS